MPWGGGSGELRAALTRLVEEHLIVERDGLIAGIHQIRSRGIVDAIHRVPPPELKKTVVSVLSALRGSGLSRFVYEVLREEPNLEESVLQTLEGMAGNDVECLVASLRGLELLDFHRQASAWVTIAERHDIPHSSRPVALFFANCGHTVSPSSFPPPLRAATTEMAMLPVPKCDERPVTR